MFYFVMYQQFLFKELKELYKIWNLVSAYLIFFVWPPIESIFFAVKIIHKKLKSFGL